MERVVHRRPTWATTTPSSTGSARPQAGIRPPSPRSAAVILRMCDSESEAARLSTESIGRPVLVGTPEQLVEQVAAYAAAGTDELIIPDFNHEARPEAPEIAERFMSEVVAAL